METQASTTLVLRHELSTGSVFVLGLGVALGLAIIVTYIVYNHAELHDIFFGGN